MQPKFSLIKDVSSEVEIPQDGILSRLIYSDEQLNVMVFAFDQGQELSEHTASKPAILHFIQGEADVALGDDSKQVGAGAWVHMPPHLPHSILAKSPLVMLLYLLKGD